MKPTPTTPPTPATTTKQRPGLLARIAGGARGATGGVVGVARKVRIVGGGRRLSARYDAAQTHDLNKRHWAMADLLSADAGATPAVRKTLRARSRYECANNSYANGILRTLAYDLIGTSPRLQLLAEDAAANQEIEKKFHEWLKAADVAGKLRTARMARGRDGEAFFLLRNNEKLATKVKLDLALIECDRVETPDASLVFEKNATDGIEFDESGNPVRYHILREHPGDAARWSTVGGYGQYDRVEAGNVIHWFRRDRPEQWRGVSELAPALELFALLRRYSLAVINAAETIAEHTTVIETSATDTEETDEVEALDVFELERNMATVLPKGYKLGQPKAEQPTATYTEFKKAVLGEVARCLDVPFNIAAGDSSGYNYSSGRLDHQTYFKTIDVEREQLGCVVLDRVFSAWAREAVLISGYLSMSARKAIGTLDMPPRRWMFDGRGHVDPVKEANAQETQLKNGTTTLADEYAQQGKDWQRQLRQMAIEKAEKKKLEQEFGISFDTPAPAAAAVPDGEDES